MAPDNLIPVVSNLGLGGLLFYMWWTERREKEEEKSKNQSMYVALMQTHEERKSLVNVIQDNTRIMSDLKSLFEHLMNEKKEEICGTGKRH